MTDATGSPERQLAACKSYADARGWEIIGSAEDLDVSAHKFPPKKRKGLGSWLERPRDYDVLLVWRVDRLVRQVKDMAELIGWASDNDVALVSATESHFDTSSEFGQVIAILVAIFAQMETAAGQERTRKAFDDNVKAGKFRGGHPPFGYRAVKDAVKGWRLEVDPVTSALVVGIVDRVIDGDRLSTICNELNRDGVPTPHALWQRERGKDVKPGWWRTSNLRRALESPTLLGQVVVTDRETGVTSVLRDDSGEPVRRVEPLITRERFLRLQAALGEQRGRNTPYKRSEALLLRVLHCACGRPMYRKRGRHHLYYACPSTSLGVPCGNRSVRLDKADEAAEKFVLSILGDVERMERVYDPGEDHSGEVAEIDAELVDVVGLVGTRPFRSGPARERMLARAEALQQRRDRLAAADYRPAGYRMVPTGVLFRQYWDDLDMVGRNVELRRIGFRIDHGNEQFDMAFTKDLAATVGAAVGDMPEQRITEARGALGSPTHRARNGQ